jgi:hypothetical protein
LLRSNTEAEAAVIDDGGGGGGGGGSVDFAPPPLEQASKPPKAPTPTTQLRQAKIVRWFMQAASWHEGHRPETAAAAEI